MNFLSFGRSSMFSPLQQQQQQQQQQQHQYPFVVSDKKVVKTTLHKVHKIHEENLLILVALKRSTHYATPLIMVSS
jgi:hypothetical protein